MIALVKMRKAFGSVVAVDDVSLNVPRGTFITLLGPSGCGKTTLLRMVSGFETPDQGTIELDGQDVTALPPYQRDVNQVFQSYALFPHLSVRRNIEFGLKMKKLARGEIDRRVSEVVEMVELRGMEDRKPNQLSGGQKQRVALARAIVNQPKVLLLDEPLAALDARLRQAMQIELKRLQKRLGITFVFVTHDQDEAMVMSDVIAVMNDGKIEQLGEPTEVYHRPRTKFVAEFVGHSNLWDAEVVGPDAIKVGDLALRVPNLPNRQRVTVLVRPENVRIGDEGIDAEVREKLFVGAITHLRLVTRGGVEISAMSTATNVDVGQRVRVLIDPTDVVIL